MAYNGGRDADVPEEEDILGDDVRDQSDEEAGEDLLGDDMVDDYAADPENDRYDPEMIDDDEHEPLTIEQRRAAERALQARDAQTRRRRRDEIAASPGVPLGPSPVASDAGSPGPLSASKRRRRSFGGPDGSPGGTPGGSPGGDGDDFPQDDEDGDVPESFWKLNKEKDELPEAIDARLEQKIRTCFQQFLRKFKKDDQSEPLYPDLVRRMGEEHHMHLDVNYDHLHKWEPKLGLWVADGPQRILPILNKTLMAEAARKFEVYRNMVEHTDLQELRVAIYSFPIQDKIRDLNNNYMNKLVSVVGVATKRGNVFNQVKRLYLRCAKCNYPSQAFEVAEDKELKPGACLECQSRGPWRVDRQMTLYRNYQKVTLQESPSAVDPGKMPRSKEVILYGDQVDTVRPGDEISLVGIYRCLYDVATNARTCFPVYKTELEAVHINRKGDVKVSQITDEQTQQILDLARSPNIRDRIIASMAPSIYGMKYVKTAIALSIFGGQGKMAAGKHRIRGDINTLIVGDPGLAKSQFLKYVEQTFPKAVYTTGKGASAVGLTAAMHRDENGEWALEGGAMVLADDGICLIDEFDKMNDQDRTSIHEAMEQQSISISKAGILATLQARCAVIAVANPTEGRYDPQQTFSQNVNLSDPILSRFDLLCVLKDEADAVQDERLADHVCCSHIRSHPDASENDKQVKPRLQQARAHIEPISQELLQRYIVYARKHVNPKIMKLDKEKLANFYKDIRASAFRSGGAPMTARHVESIIRLAEANARMELRQHVTSKDLDNAIGMMLESFIQSQKHQIAEELRKTFRRYIVQAAPMADQIISIVEKLFKEKFAEKRLARPGGLPPDISEVPVEMADVVRRFEQQDIDIDEAHGVMRSERFRQNFREEDGNLYRIV